MVGYCDHTPSDCHGEARVCKGNGCIVVIGAGKELMQTDESSGKFWYI